MSPVASAEAVLSAQEREEARRMFILGCKNDFGFWWENGSKIMSKDPKLGAITPTMNGMQAKINEAIEYCEENELPCRIINLKPRQGGSSAFFVGKAYHMCRSGICSAAILGDDGNTTDKLMEKWDLYAERDLMAQDWGNRPKTASNMSFTHGSGLVLETANDPRAGQGGTIQCLITSEVASYRSSGHSTGEDVFSSIYATVPNIRGTLVVEESTAQGMTGVFYTTYQGAVTFDEFKKGNYGNGFIKFFTPWFDFDDYQFDGKNGRKGLTPARRQFIADNMDEREHQLFRLFGEKITIQKLAWRREEIAGPLCSGNPDTFDREYPQDDITCFRSTGSAFFDHDGVLFQESNAVALETQIMRGDIHLQGEDETYGAWMPRRDGGGEFRVVELPRDGESYIIAADWKVGRQAAGAKGVLDTNSIKVWRAARLDGATGIMRPAQCVASTQMEDRSPTDVAIQRVKKLYRLYGNCKVVPEINNKDNICQQMVAVGITNIWTQRTGVNGANVGVGKTEAVMGFLTTGTRDGGGTRKMILDNLQRCVREQEFIATFPEVVHQMKVFLMNAQGRAEAAPGEHDDEVMQTAIALYAIGAATMYVNPRLQTMKKAGGSWRPQPPQPAGGL